MCWWGDSVVMLIGFLWLSIGVSILVEICGLRNIWLVCVVCRVSFSFCGVVFLIMNLIVL